MPAAAPPLSDAALGRVAEHFRALSEPARLKLLQLLCAAPRSVNDLAAAAGLTQANTSKHLSILAAAGFVSRERDGTRIVYSVTDRTPEALCATICSHLERKSKAELEIVRGGTRSRR